MWLALHPNQLVPVTHPSVHALFIAQWINSRLHPEWPQGADLLDPLLPRLQRFKKRICPCHLCSRSIHCRNPPQTQIWFLPPQRRRSTADLVSRTQLDRQHSNPAASGSVSLHTTSSYSGLYLAHGLQFQSLTQQIFDPLQNTVASKQALQSILQANKPAAQTSKSLLR